MYAVVSTNPDPNPRGGGQLPNPNPNEYHSTLTSAIRGISPPLISIYIYIASESSMILSILHPDMCNLGPHE